MGTGMGTVLLPGSGTSFLVAVTIPTDTLPGDSDAVTITAVAHSDPRVPPASAGAVLKTMVVPTYRVYLPMVMK